jgi:hypothetical protein
VNAIAATAPDPIRIMAALATKAPSRSALGKFADLINILTDTDVLTGAAGRLPALVSLPGFETPLATSCSPVQIADALVRSMLGFPGTGTGTRSAAASTQEQADDRQLVAETAELSQQLGTTAAASASGHFDSLASAAEFAAEPLPSGNSSAVSPPGQSHSKQSATNSPPPKPPAKSAVSTAATAGTAELLASTIIVTSINSAPPPATTFTPTQSSGQNNDSLLREPTTTAQTETRVETTQSGGAPIEQLAFSVRLTATGSESEIVAALVEPSNLQPALQLAPQATPEIQATVPAPATEVPLFVSQQEAIVPAPNLPEAIAAPPLNKSVAGSTSAPQSARTASPDTKARAAGGDRPDAPALRVAAVGVVSDADYFSHAFASPAPANPGYAEPRETNTRAPFNSVAETLRTSEPLVEPSSALAVATVQGITLRLAPPEAPAVDLHVSERGGEIHVAVRTSDTTLQTSLRQDLSTLTNSLERAGYRAETYVPREISAQATSSPQAGTGDDRHQQGSPGRGAGGNPSNGQQQQRQRSDQRRKNWIQELEKLK